MALQLKNLRRSHALSVSKYSCEYFINATRQISIGLCSRLQLHECDGILKQLESSKSAKEFDTVSVDRTSEICGLLEHVKEWKLADLKLMCHLPPSMKLPTSLKQQRYWEENLLSQPHYSFNVHRRGFKSCATKCPLLIDVDLQIHSRAMSTEINDRVNNKGTLLSQEVSQDARAIFHAAVSAVYPPQMLRKSLQVSKDGSEVTVNERNYSLKNNVHVVGFGKAVSGMARALEDLIGPHIVNGIISIPYGTKDLFMSIGKQDLYVREDSKIRVCEGATNNIPDKLAQTTAESILQLAKNLTDNDILVVLISGGGSSLLPSPIPPVTLDDLIQLTYVVQGAGGSIGELNTLRQNVEQLKGGGLARIAKPAKVLSLILSDVIEDKLDIISSGPTAPLYSSARQCLQVLERLGVKDKVPETIRTVLNQRALDRKSEQTMPQHQVPFEDQMSHVQNVIIGSNTIATEAAVMKAEAMGYVPVILTNNLQGEAREAADIFVQLAQYMMLAYGDHRGDQSVVLTETELRLIGRGLTKSDMRRLEFALTKAQNSRSAVCIISGGETTVQMTGNGKGGRSQEMALAFGIKLNQLMTDKGSSLKVYPNFHIEFLSAGTDGQDGPTDAAGAVVGKGFVAKAMEQGVDVTSFLANNDSYSLFKSLSQDDCLIHTGLTGTNVMDIQILIVKRIEV